MKNGRGIAAVAVRSLERGFQGENLSVDGWGLLGDQWITGTTSSSSSSASKMGSSHSWHWPPRPKARLKTWHSWHRLSPTARATYAALVHGVGHQRTAPTEVGA